MCIRLPALLSRLSTRWSQFQPCRVNYIHLDMVALFYVTVGGFVNFLCSCFGVFKIMILATMQAASITANQWRYLPNGAIAVHLIKKRCVLLMVVHSETCACCRKRFARRRPITPTITLEVVQVHIRLQGL